MSRRSLIASAGFAGSLSSLRGGAAQTLLSVETAALPGGVEVRDYRVFPTPDVKRFIVEIHNTTDDPIDTPTIAVRLNHLPGPENVGIAVPALDVLYPHTSGALIGVAPPSLLSDDNWGVPQWFLCSELQSQRSKELESLSIEYAYEQEVMDDDYLHVLAMVTNKASQAADDFQLGGELYDQSARLCGTLMPWRAYWIEAGETQEVNFVIAANIEYIGNPFVLIDTVHNMTIHMTLQPKQMYRAPVCVGAFEWNR